MSIANGEVIPVRYSCMVISMNYEYLIAFLVHAMVVFSFFELFH